MHTYVLNKLIEVIKYSSKIYFPKMNSMYSKLKIITI